MKLKIVFENQTYNKIKYRKLRTFRQKTKNILTNRHTSRLAVDMHTQRGIHQIKYEILYSAFTEVKKY